MSGAKLSSVVSAVDMRHFIKNFNFSSFAYFFRCVVLNKKIAKSVCWRCRSMLIYMPFMFGFSSTKNKLKKKKKMEKEEMEQPRQQAKFKKETRGKKKK